VVFLKRREEIPRRLPSLDVVIRHHDMNHVLRAPFRHMAAQTIAGRRVPSVANELFDPVLMACLTNRDVLTLRGFPSQDVMRVVAGGASQLTGRLLKARGLAQSIALMSDLEFVIVARPGSVVKKQLVVSQQLSGTIRKHAPVESSHRIWQLRAGGLKMTLQANFHLSFRI
jgi:hypothetical protein